MKAIDLFPYWHDNRELLAEVIRSIRDDELDVRPAPGLRSLGEVLRHIITTEEYWWHGGIHGRPFAEWRAAGWDTKSVEEKEAHRAQRFPTVASIAEGLRAAHEPIELFLSDLEANDLCQKRTATWPTWGEENTLRWIIWHLVEHDQHHRAQVYTRLRRLGHQPPQIWPRHSVMNWTPAVAWHDGEEEMRNIIPFWKPVRQTLHAAVESLSEGHLVFRPTEGLPSLHDLILHIVTWEDFLIRQNLKGEMARDWGPIRGWFWRSEVPALAASVGSYFPSVESLLSILDAVHAHTAGFMEGLTLRDLARIAHTPRGPQVWHHVLWYAREHAVHHRAQIFLRMRMLGLTPPDL